MTVAVGPSGGLIGGVVGRNEAAALNALYANYLAAGATCLTARGYQVSF
jgi:S-methylmethionine-dependent homocysteine/selenocysteine methylase